MAVTVLIAVGQRLRIDRTGLARPRLTCPQSEQSPPCTGTLALRTRAKVPFKGKLRRVVLAKRRFRIPRGQTQRLRLKLPKAKLALVRRTRRARSAVAVAHVQDQAGNKSRIAKPVKLAPQLRRAR